MDKHSSLEGRVLADESCDFVLDEATDTVYSVGRRGNSNVETKGTLVEWNMT